MRTKLIAAVASLALLSNSAIAQTASPTCTPPQETANGEKVFEFVTEQLASELLPELKSASWIAPVGTSGRGSWQARLEAKSGGSSCYGYAAIQDYATATNSLCRINDELNNPKPPASFSSLRPTSGTPAATVGYTYRATDGSFESRTSWLDRYQVGSLVYCPGGEASEIEDFHNQVWNLAKQAVAKLAAAPLKDISSSDFAEAIDYLAWHEIAGGYSDGTWRPEAAINRAEFTKIVVAAAKQPIEPGTELGELKFNDVEPAWYVPYLRVAVEEKYLAGYPDGTFRPAANVSVAEGLKIALSALAPDQVSPAKTGEAWYQPFVAAAKQQGWYLTDWTKFDQPLTRGQMAELIYRLRTETRSEHELPFVVLSPAVDGGRITISASQLPLAVSGRAAAGTKITVNKGYTLTSCCQAATEPSTWTYNLDTKWKNIGPGENNYELVATDPTGKEIGRAKLTVVVE